MLNEHKEYNLIKIISTLAGWLFLKQNVYTSWANGLECLMGIQFD